MPERGQGNLKTPGVLLVFSLLLGKPLGAPMYEEDEGSGVGPALEEEMVMVGMLPEQSSTIEQWQGHTPTEGDSQLPATTPSPLSEEEAGVSLELLLMVGIPVVLLLLLCLLVVFLIRYNKRRKSKPVPSSHGSQSVLQSYELGSENVKSPIFEEDTPSVMEIEMEELDKWMNSINRNAESECLPTVKEEEKESNHNPSDAES
ncbi:transmembrane protein 154 [Monodelphis domestica]|uniref:transmembrane protein 154 n=1 Tax=Monodelphis domestica TaxID=13616 RepID=UPI0024E20DBB|nr:transmembrane protein 154 [Monodelphis domestica]